MNKPHPNYFMVNRALLSSVRWLAEPFTRGQAWLDLFGLANHTKGSFWVRGMKIEVERGQLAYSELTLARRWKWSRGKVRRFLNELETVQDIVQQKTNLTSLITITKYDKWQGNGTTDDTPDSTTDGTHKKNNKRMKEDIADSRISTLISFFSEQCLSLKGFKPGIDGADGKAVQKALKGMTEPEVREAVLFYLKSPKADDCGVTLTACLSKHSLNVWKQNRRKNDWQTIA